MQPLPTILKREKHPVASPVTSFRPVIATKAKLLILGSMPGVKSLQEQQYYAHPRNAFWQIMSCLFGLDIEADYSHRLEQIQQHSIALWDVAHQCIRPGSLDSDINRDSVIPNEISNLLKENPGIHTICFNGQTAEKMFKRHFPDLHSSAKVSFITLPSTSPAHASLKFSEKLEAWHIVKDLAESIDTRCH